MKSFLTYLIESTLESALKDVLSSEDANRKKGFLFPDGTIMGFPIPYIHNEIARKAGVSLEDVMNAGVCRYVPGIGVELSKALTFAQAQTLKDLWDSYFRNDPLTIDVIGGNGWSVKASKNFGESDEWTTDTIRNWTLSQV